MPENERTAKEMLDTVKNAVVGEAEKTEQEGKGLVKQGANELTRPLVNKGKEKVKDAAKGLKDKLTGQEEFLEATKEMNPMSPLGKDVAEAKTEMDKTNNMLSKAENAFAGTPAGQEVSQIKKNMNIAMDAVMNSPAGMMVKNSKNLLKGSLIDQIKLVGATKAVSKKMKQIAKKGAKEIKKVATKVMKQTRAVCENIMDKAVTTGKVVAGQAVGAAAAPVTLGASSATAQQVAAKDIAAEKARSAKRTAEANRDTSGSAAKEGFTKVANVGAKIGDATKTMGLADGGGVGALAKAGAAKAISAVKDQGKENNR